MSTVNLFKGEWDTLLVSVFAKLSPCKITTPLVMPTDAALDIASQPNSIAPVSEPGSPSSLTPRRVLPGNLLAAVALVAMTIILFWQAVRYDFLNYDDGPYVFENAAVQQGLSWAGLRYALTSGDVGSWAPLTWLSYEANSSWFGTQAASYRIVNILLHAGAGAFLFFALRSLLKSFWTSFVLAAIFLIHPLRTESVIWIAERKDVLCACFWTLGLWAYSAYAKQPAFGRWLLVLLCYVGGLLSKFMMITFPLVLLLLDFWPLNRAGTDWTSLRAQAWPRLREKLPFFLVGSFVHWLAVRALVRVDTLDPTWTDLGGKLARVPENYVFYLGKIFWPAHRSILYPFTEVHMSWSLLCVALLGGITLLAVWNMWRRPWLLAGWLWFLVALVPVVGFVTFSHFFVTDRYTYLPSIGITQAVVVSMEQLARRNRYWRAALAALAAAVLTACFLATRADLPRWQNSMSLSDAALRVGPHFVAYYNRGDAFRKSSQPERAVADFTAAIRLVPNYVRGLNSRAAAWIDLGNYDEAIRDCDAVLRLEPEMASAYNNRGNARSWKGELNQAIADYDHAIKLSPTKALYYNNRAAAFYDFKQYGRAKADLEKCVQLGGQPHPGLVRALEEATRARP